MHVVFQSLQKKSIPKVLTETIYKFYLNSNYFVIGGDFKIVKREVRVILYNNKSGQYIGNTA